MMRRLLPFLLLGLCALTPLRAGAEDILLRVPPEQVERFQTLTAELRCLVCQNQSLADSNADLAVDMRREILAMIERGDSDAQIVAFLVERYGDFVRYRPPVKASTLLLWYGPFAMLFLGLVLIVVLVRRKRRSAPAPLSDADRDRLEALLKTPQDQDRQI